MHRVDLHGPYVNNNIIIFKKSILGIIIIIRRLEVGRFRVRVPATSSSSSSANRRRSVGRGTEVQNDEIAVAERTVVVAKRTLS